MKNLKFLNLLRTLKKEEVSAFHKYLKQAHGGEEVALRVFDYIRKFAPDFQEEKKLEMAYAYAQIFSSDLPDDATERKRTQKNVLNTLSDLHAWLKDFLLAEKIGNDTLESQALWLGILQERGLQAEFSKHTARFYAQAKAVPQKSTDGYLMEMVASYFHYQDLSAVMPVPDREALQECLATWATAAEIIQLKMDCRITNLERVRPPAASDSPSIQSPELPGKPIAATNPLLLLYRDIRQLVETEQEVYYDRVKAGLDTWADQLAPDELHGIISYLRNYAAIQIRNGRDDIFKEKVHQLNKFGLQYASFNQTGVMSPTQFTSIVSVACSVNDFKWATSFIEAYTRFLPTNVRQDSINLARAIICFEQKDYPAARTLIASTEFRDIHHVIRSRSLILMMDMDIGEGADKILGYCAAFIALLGRTPKPETEAVKATLAFIKFVRMLVLEKVEQQTLIDMIKKAPHLYLRSWLLAQAANYKGRYIKKK